MVESNCSQAVNIRSDMFNCSDDYPYDQISDVVTIDGSEYNCDYGLLVINQYVHPSFMVSFSPDKYFRQRLTTKVLSKLV